MPRCKIGVARPADGGDRRGMVIKDAFAQSIGSVIKNLKTAPEGLKSAEAISRLKRFGPNEPTKVKPRSVFIIFWDQLKNPLIYILLLASVVNIFLGYLLDAAVILFIVVLNSLIGFLQELKAQNALAALKRIISLRSKVIRDGQELEISSYDLVPGDIVMLESGMKVSADLRLIETNALKIDESLLTGESAPVYKNTRVLSDTTILADRKNMAFSGTFVSTGRGLGVVTAAGQNTELGQIAQSLAVQSEEPTILHKKIGEFSRFLLLIVIWFSAFIFIVGSLRGINFYQIFLTAIAAMVSVVPEGLPAVITITLTTGVYRMAAQKALSRRLAIIETLGAVTVIASDKTGTLTHNQMTLERIVIGDRIIKVVGDGYRPQGLLTDIYGRGISKGESAVEQLLKMAILCNNSQIIQEQKQWTCRGDPTECALVSAGGRFGLQPQILNHKMPRIDEIPFSEELTYMATLHKWKTRRLIAVKGSLEQILHRSSYWLIDNKKTKLSRSQKLKIISNASRLADEGYRILAIAKKEVSLQQKTIGNSDVAQLTFLGFCGIDDPPREEAIQAVKDCQKAGIRVVMITGDYPQTARAVARKMGILGLGGDEVISGLELDQMPESQLARDIKQVSVFARISPQQKLKLVRLLQRQGEIVGVTGDGVNDASTLKQADVGVSMGIGGTDAAREASDMVLLDNNFAALVKAIEEGRTVLQNIKRVIFFLLSTNSGELLVLSAALVVGLPLPLTPIQILWINLITDTSAGTALAFEPKNPEVLTWPPRSPKEPLINKIILKRILLVAAVMTIATLAVYWPSVKGGVDLAKARSIVFALMGILQIFNLFNCRSFRLSIFQTKFFSNKWIWVFFFGSLILTYLTIEWEPFQKLFHTVSLESRIWLELIAISLSVVVVVEIEKLIRRIIRTRY